MVNLTNFSSENFKIRDFRISDANEIFQIHKENEKFFEDFSFSEEFIIDISQRSDFKFFVCEYNKDRKILGFSGVLFNQNTGRAEIGPIAVRREFQGMKIGSGLLEQTLKFLIEIGIRRSTARIKVKNTNAIKFFEKFGFSIEGYFKEYTKKGEDIVQVVKFLY
ncbi:MAG: GNAT family N-acetyltransferase [Candidatus Altiarchaeota archaeon]